VLGLERAGLVEYAADNVFSLCCTFDSVTLVPLSSTGLSNEAAHDADGSDEFLQVEIIGIDLPGDAIDDLELASRLRVVRQRISHAIKRTPLRAEGGTQVVGRGSDGAD
jgi:hypothetical protein